MKKNPSLRILFWQSMSNAWFSLKTLKQLPCHSTKNDKRLMFWSRCKNAVGSPHSHEGNVNFIPIFDFFSFYNFSIYHPRSYEKIYFEIQRKNSQFKI